MKITYSLSSNFLGDNIRYSADLLKELKDHQSKFPGLEELHVELIELPYHKIGDDNTKSITFLNDNKKLELRLTFHRYYDRNMKVTGVPSPLDVYQRIRFMLNKAATEYTAPES